MDDDYTVLHLYMLVFQAELITLCLLTGFLIDGNVTDNIWGFLNAAAHVISKTWKCNRGFCQVRRHKLCCLDMSERIQFRIAVTIRQNDVFMVLHHCT